MNPKWKVIAYGQGTVVINLNMGTQIILKKEIYENICIGIYKYKIIDNIIWIYNLSKELIHYCKLEKEKVVII